MPQRYRQEVLNVILAQLLQERGVVSAPESIKNTKDGRKMPDVIVRYNGLRLAIEGEVDDNASAKEDAISSAEGRVVDGIAHIGLSVVYPPKLRKYSFEKVKGKMEESELEISIVSEVGKTKYVSGDIDLLESNLRQLYDQLVREEIVRQAVENINEGINSFAKEVSGNDGVVERLADVLGIREIED